jgi:hypothetical protein
VILEDSERLCIVCKSENLIPYQLSGRHDIPSRRPSVQSIIRPDDKNFPSGPSFVSRRFELLQLVFVRTFQQHVWTTLSVRQASGFLSKTQLWEDCCNRLDDVDSRLDALIHKASIAFKIQMSGCQSAWSGLTCIRYGNCLHQINRSDDHPFGLDSRSLYMEIACSGSATVRMTGNHRLDVAQKKERILAKFSGSRSHSCPFGRPLTTVRTAPMFYQARPSFEPNL